ncbi:MAG: tryptophan--tRNA ligase [Candidatus Omnitrophica bacterium]|nr:tryptophan--tRNA ligase [Candidatus Omnitrophota bacterium]MDD5311277.1 tryptophan--tRNA ligase [Candidatus Omnitrophota bacterium]MDD5546843.1 tryptophan--tRNA ligase [Candidatus Omnitrophota bacterium]
MKKRILSGMRPTGKLHLGHLAGALKNWVGMQEKYDCFYMVADYHALMSEYADPSAMKENAIDNVADFLACGLDPDKSVIFVQSHVPEHLELDMILSAITPLSWLERCPTYKEQLREVEGRDLATYGFLGYPVLQAADILIYKANAVPVGEDQLPHLELTREIARRFRHFYKKEIFPEPEAIMTATPRLLGVDNRKMSKSYGNAVNLSDSPEEIKKKIKSMITDPKRIRKDDPGHPDICNVYSYYKFFFPEEIGNLSEECKAGNIGCVEDKGKLADCIVELLRPIQEKRNKLIKDRKEIEAVLEKGDRKAREFARGTMDEVKKAVGI